MINKTFDEGWWLNNKKPKTHKMNKQKKTNTLSSYHLKLLKDDVTWDGVQNICNVYLKHLQLKWAYKVARILCTIIPQLF